MTGGVSETAAAARFAMVTVADAIAPAGSDPKFNEDGDSVIAGVIGLARFCGSLGAFN